MLTEWFQASAGTASPARLRRANTSDTVRLLWVLLQASSGASPEVPLLRVPCSERYEPGCSKSEQSVDDLWVWRLGDSACLPTRPGESSEEFTSRLLFQALRTVTCLASEAPASEGALWLFHLIVSAVGAWLLLSTGSDGLIIMLLRETTVSGLFFGDPSPVLSASLNCRVMSCLWMESSKGALTWLLTEAGSGSPTWMLPVDVCLSRGASPGAARGLPLSEG